MSSYPPVPPLPLVPADVDLRDFGFMPLDVATLMSSSLWVKAKKDPRVGHAAVSLWCKAWHEVPASSLPNDDELLADFAGCDDVEFARIKERVLSNFVLCSDGRLYHETVAKKALEAWDAKLARMERTRAATAAREAKRRAAEAEANKPRRRGHVKRGDQRDVQSDVQRDVERDVHQGTGTGTGTGILSISPTSVGESTPSSSTPESPPAQAPAAPTPARKRAAPAPALPCPDQVAEDVWTAWLDLRRKKRAPVSDVVLQQARKEASLAKLSLEAFLRIWCFRGSQGLHADWITPQDRQRFGSSPASDRVGRQLQTAALMVNPPESPGNRKPAEPVQEVIDVSTRRIA
ncbi:MAG: DUF1376 domain-containing protein [Steroidobacteraceae bacterium]|nr:DUF1376 domain-containing protein [Steroidobacteraceae bacterium]